MLAYHKDYILEFSTIDVRQEDVSTKKQVDGDMKRHIALNRLEAVLQFKMGWD